MDIKHNTMQNLVIISLLLIACVSVARADWFYHITYSDNNCTHAVAIQMTLGDWCTPSTTKRSTEIVQPSDICTPIDGYDNMTYVANYVCGGNMPEFPEIDAYFTWMVETFNALNCTSSDFANQYLYMANFGVTNYFGFLSSETQQTGMIQLNSTCQADKGLLAFKLCPNSLSCTEASGLVTSECSTDEKLGLTFLASGCNGPPPSAIEPIAETVPSANNASQSANPISSPTPTSKPVAQTPRTSNASIVSAGILGVVSLLLF